MNLLKSILASLLLIVLIPAGASAQELDDANFIVNGSTNKQGLKNDDVQIDIKNGAANGSVTVELHSVEKKFGTQLPKWISASATITLDANGAGSASFGCPGGATGGGWTYPGSQPNGRGFYKVVINGNSGSALSINFSKVNNVPGVDREVHLPGLAGGGGGGN